MLLGFLESCMKPGKNILSSCLLKESDVVLLCDALQQSIEQKQDVE